MFSSSAGLVTYRQRFRDLHTRVREFVERLDDSQVNWRPNPQSNSIANLVVHMVGSMRQRIASEIGGGPDRRDRSIEFSLTFNASRSKLVSLLDEGFLEVEKVLAELPPERLAEAKTVYNHQNVASVRTSADLLFTVVNHVSGHVGQIIYIAKMLAPDPAPAAHN